MKQERSWICWACYFDDFGEEVWPYYVGYFDPRSLDERCSRCGAGPSRHDQQKLRLLEMRDAVNELLRDPEDAPEGMLTLATVDGWCEPAPSSAPSSTATERILEEMKQLREGVEDIRASGPMMEPSQVAVHVATAMKLLGCGRSRVFELLKKGLLRRAPKKVGRETMILTASIDALLQAPSTQAVKPRSRMTDKRNRSQADSTALVADILKIPVQ